MTLFGMKSEELGIAPHDFFGAKSPAERPALVGSPVVLVLVVSGPIRLQVAREKVDDCLVLPERLRAQPGLLIVKKFLDDFGDGFLRFGWGHPVSPWGLRCSPEFSTLPSAGAIGLWG